jgi:hypothetical protein
MKVWRFVRVMDSLSDWNVGHSPPSQFFSITHPVCQLNASTSSFLYSVTVYNFILPIIMKTYVTGLLKNKLNTKFMLIDVLGYHCWTTDYGETIVRHSCFVTHVTNSPLLCNAWRNCDVTCKGIHRPKAIYSKLQTRPLVREGATK